MDRPRRMVVGGLGIKRGMGFRIRLGPLWIGLDED